MHTKRHADYVIATLPYGQWLSPRFALAIAAYNASRTTSRAHEVVEAAKADAYAALMRAAA